MTSAVFVDTNVPIYAAGRLHPLKAPCAAVLRAIAEQPEAFVTNAEVLQELLHRYLSLRLWPQGLEVLQRFADLMRERVVPVEAGDVERAAVLVNGNQTLSARDLLHAAVMQRLGADRIVSADKDFDRLPGITRLDPLSVEEWAPKPESR